MPESTIEQIDVPDVDFTQPFDENSAADAFLAHLADKPTGDDDASKKKPSEKGETKTEQKPTEEPKTKSEDSEETPETEDEEDGESEETKKYAADDVFVKVKVGEEEHEVPVKDLQRLYGQEAALTRKSQETAEARKKADAETAKAMASLKVLLDRANERAKPFKEVNWLIAAKELDADALHALTAQANSANEEVTFLQNELGNFMNALQQRHQIEHREEVKTALTELNDATNKSYIENWSDQVYDEIRAFAIGQGLPAQMVNSIASAPAIKLMQMAMLYQKGQQKVETIKVNKSAPKKIVKNTKSPAVVQPSKAKIDKAKERLARTGREDDAIAAFEALITAGKDED